MLNSKNILSSHSSFTFYKNWFYSRVIYFWVINSTTNSGHVTDAVELLTMTLLITTQETTATR